METAAIYCFTYKWQEKRFYYQIPDTEHHSEIFDPHSNTLPPVQGCAEKDNLLFVVEFNRMMEDDMSD